MRLMFGEEVLSPLNLNKMSVHVYFIVVRVKNNCRTIILLTYIIFIGNGDRCFMVGQPTQHRPIHEFILLLYRIVI